MLQLVCSMPCHAFLPSSMQPTLSFWCIVSSFACLNLDLEVPSIYVANTFPVVGPLVSAGQYALGKSSWGTVVFPPSFNLLFGRGNTRSSQAPAP